MLDVFSGVHYNIHRVTLCKTKIHLTKIHIGHGTTIDKVISSSMVTIAVSICSKSQLTTLFTTSTSCKPRDRYLHYPHCIHTNASPVLQINIYSKTIWQTKMWQSFTYNNMQRCRPAGNTSCCTDMPQRVWHRYIQHCAQQAAWHHTAARCRQ